MIGHAGLKGPSLATAMIQQRLSAVPRSTRSVCQHSLSPGMATDLLRQVSTFQSQRLRFSGQASRLGLSSFGKTPWHLPFGAIGPATVRFNSTSSARTAAQTPETATPNELRPIDDLSNIDISSIPERLGYLKELGLDYGWGPTAMMQYIIEHIHLSAGMPWWASVLAAGLLIRLALLKPMLDSSNISAKMHNAKHIINPLRNEMLRLAKENKQLEVQEKRAEIQRLNAERGIKLSKTFIPMLQLPLGYGIFRAVNGLSSLPVPSLSVESFAWLKDLTVADPLYILPSITALMMYMTFKVCPFGTSDFTARADQVHNRKETRPV